MIKFNDLTIEDIEKIIAECQVELSKRTNNNYVGSLIIDPEVLKEWSKPLDD